MQTKRIIIIFILFALGLGVSPALGQKKTNKTLKVTQIVKPADSAASKAVPTLNDFGFIVKLDGEGNATVALQINEASNKVNAQDLSRIYDYFSLLQVSKTRTPKIPFDPVIIIEAAPSLGFGKILEFIKPLRRAGDNKIKIAAGENDFLIVPAKIAPSRLVNVKPNPLTLIVQLQNSGFITINNDPYGSMGDVQKLSNKLKEIFKERQNNGVFREMSNEIETSVSIKVSDSRPFEDVRRLVTEIKKTGSDRIFLYLEDLPVITRRNELIY